MRTLVVPLNGRQATVVREGGGNLAAASAIYREAENVLAASDQASANAIAAAQMASADAERTSADRIAVGADRVAVAADRQQTGLDVLASEAAADEATAARDAAAREAAEARQTVSHRASGIPSRNLFDKAAVTAGKILPPTGIVQDSATYSVSDFIPVWPGETYTASDATGFASPMRFSCYFDAARNRVPGGSNAAIGAMTIPAGVAYVRVTVATNALAGFQLERGSVASPYEAYSAKTFLDPEAVRPRTVDADMLAEKAVGTGKVSFLRPGKNLFDKAKATLGIAISHNNESIIVNPTYDVSDFVAVTPGVAYHGVGASRGARYIAFYDAAKTFVPGGLEAASPGVIDFTPPAGIAFVRMSIWHDNLDSFQLEVGSAGSAYEPFSLILEGEDGTQINIRALADRAVTTPKIATGAVTPDKTRFLVRGKNLFDKATALIGFILGPNGGSPSANATYDLSDYIPVTPGVAYAGRGAEHGMRFTCYFNANKVRVAGGSNAEVSVFTPPSGVAFVRVTLFHSDLNTFQFEQAAAATPYEPYGYKFTPDIIGGGGGSSVPVSGWYGKRLATQGDSITANFNWQPALAEAVGLIISNFGIGGTKMSGPAGDTNAGCQDARINAIPTDMDVVGAQFGTNDWAQNVPLGDDASTDPLTFSGALNTWVAKARARWPDKILVLATTPYGEIPAWSGRPGWTSPAHNALGLTTRAYAAAIRRACDRHGIACVDVDRNGGWGAENITPFMGGSTTDHLHPASGSPAAIGLARAWRGGLRLIEPFGGANA